jgi:hypothetical protein
MDVSFAQMSVDWDPEANAISPLPWIDQRLVRDGHIARCGPQALALYLLLVTVADAQGLSYYSDKTEHGCSRSMKPSYARPGAVCWQRV